MIRVWQTVIKGLLSRSCRLIKFPNPNLNEEKKLANPLITENDVRKVAHLARLTLNEKDIPERTKNLVNILDMIAHINDRDTQNITPMSSPFADTELFLRDDIVTEPNKRDAAHLIAPATESGLYLVPQVID
ncbi:MAG: gatC [Gammaproteobacteria bacterium]|jgi:aspartyl-tRNA(Asn)/glutamyl-tRNA(Gln) amidotransferase subunit C|nr:gatC [Gammaproteobacteria bacterium]